MEITYDAAKDAVNVAKHGVPLALAAELEWDSALVWPDTRQHYGESRQSALALLGARVYFVAFVDRAEGKETRRRIISLRKANDREKIRYEKVFDAT